MRLRLWLVSRYFRSGRKIFGSHITLSILALTVGVACLVVAMGVISGYVTTLRTALIDSFGHLVIVKRGQPIGNIDNFIESVQNESDEIKGVTPFLYVEAIAANSGQIQGVLLEGAEPETYSNVVNIERHVVEGHLDLGPEVDGAIPATIGKVLRRRLKLNIGDVFRVVVPVTDRYGGDRFKPRAMKLRLTGVLDLGRYDFDERYIILDLKALQKFSTLNGLATGVRLRLQKDDRADFIGRLLVSKLGYDYIAKTWFDSNKSLFEAVEYEKPVIFFIVCLIVIAAGFSVAGSLYVSVLRRYRDISVLKTIGAEPKFIRSIFTTQGLMIGFVGSIAGLVLGVLICQGLTYVQSFIDIFPGDVYRIDKVVLDLKWLDILSIFLASMSVCFIASFAPARRGARLSAVEGLRYE